jgi:glycosyltransferase involved in cell wall biosynthesis
VGRASRIGLYSPYFGSTLGGGERYLAETARVVRDAKPEAEVEIVSPVPADRSRYERMLNVDLDGIGLRSTNRRVTRAHRLLNSLAALRPLRDRAVAWQAGRSTRSYDLLLAMVYRIPVPNGAPRGVLLCQFPYPGRTHLGGYQCVVCQSEYVRRWVREYWGLDAVVVNPPVDVPDHEPEWARKLPVVLSVGRFAATGHVKRHDLMVEAFRQLCDEGLAGWELHLAGGVHREGPHAGYFESIEERARGYPIRLHPDLPFGELEELYERASIYWHAAGYGADAERAPEALEHFGMATAEAMARGAVPVAIGLGGQPEVVEDGVDGFLWTEPEQLKERTLELVRDPVLLRRLGERARASSRRFSVASFRAAMRAALAPHLP